MFAPSSCMSESRDMDPFQPKHHLIKKEVEMKKTMKIERIFFQDNSQYCILKLFESCFGSAG